LIEKKGFGDLIEACRLLRAQRTVFRCEVIGEGPLEAELRAQIDASGLADVVTLPGPLPQHAVIERLAQSTVFALPCATETGGGMDNLPTVVMEAMAAGLPVISTALGGVPEMVVDGVTGFLVPEHAPSVLAEALARVLGDRVFAQSLGDAGRQRAAERFSIEKNVQLLRGLFQQLDVL
jgi:glycosyltransferase involved in cell wall biosynthesis